jgi:hypothetical protein
MIALGLVAHRHGGVVGVQHLRLQHPELEQLPERRQQESARRHPIAHGRAWQFGAEPFEALFGAMQWNVILIFIDDDLCQQARPRQSLVERLRRLGRDGDVSFATLARVLDALVLDDKHLGRLVVVLLGRKHADFATHGAALGAEPFQRGQLVAALFAAQLPRRPTPTVRLAFATPARFRLNGGRRRRGRLGLGQFWKQQRLVRIDRFRRPASAQQSIEPLLHLFAVATFIAQREEQLGNQLLQNAGVIGKFCRIEDGRRRRCRRRRGQRCRCVRAHAG